tara:strand:- start:49 stop:384 length:336 start_codon:yes stop_codon:yes gene_type:complete
MNHEAIRMVYPNVQTIDDTEGCFDFDGNKVEIDTDVVNEKEIEIRAAEPMRLLRQERNRKIAETDWWVLPDRTASQEQKDYRQALRDLPSTASPKIENGHLTNVTWPTKPN